MTTQLVTQGVIGLVLLWGICKCIAIARRPATNTLAALGLGAVLAAWTGSTVIAFLVHLDHTAAKVGIVLVLLPVLVLYPAGFVLAVIGLVQMRRNRSAYSQGRRQAWSAIAIAGVIGTVALVTAVWQIVEHLPREVDEPQVLDALNVRFEVPPKGWRSTPAEKLNDDARFALVNGYAGMWFILIAEAAGPEFAMSTEGLAEFAEDKMRSALATYEQIERREHVVNDLAGILTVSRGRTGGADLLYVHWVCSINGYHYQLTVWGAARKRHDQVRSKAEELFRSFRLIDSQRMATPNATLPDYASERFGLEGKFAGAPLQNWDGVAEKVASAELGGLAGPQAAFVVTAVSLLGHRPDAGDFAVAIVDALDVVPASQCRATGGAPPPQGFEGVSFRCSAEIEGRDYEYEIQALRGEHFGYAICGWTVSGYQNQKRFFEDLRSRIVVHADHPALTDASVLSERERRRHAAFFAALGRHDIEEGHPAAASRYLETATSLAPDNPEIFQQRLLALTRASEYGAAYDLLMSREGRFEQDQGVWSFEPYLLAMLGKDDAAVDKFRALFDAGYADDNDFTIFIEALERVGLPDEALERAEAYHRRHASAPSARMLAQLLGRRGDHSRAIEVLTEAQCAAPSLEDLAVELIVAHEQAEHHREAIEIAEQWIGKLEHPDNMYFLKGRNELALERYREAKQSFEEVLRRNPAHEAAQEHLQIVSSLLGQGANTILKYEIPAVPLPPGLLASSGGDITTREKAGAVVTGRAHAALYRRDREWRITRYLKIKLLDERSLSRFSAMHVGFDARGERLYVNALRVRDEKGAVVATGSVDDYYVLDEDEDGLATHDKVATLPVPGLEAGYSIELITTKQYKAPPDRVPYMRHMFHFDLPVTEDMFSIEGDVEDVTYRASNGLPEPERQGSRLVWKVSGIRSHQAEPFQEHPTRHLPTLWITDRRAAWEDLAREYLTDLEPRLHATGALDAVRVDSNAPAALARYVQKSLRYQGIEFGPRGRIPLPAAQTIKNRYGDCKDHALLLHLLLERSGEPSFLALVNTNDPIREDVPSLDQFNHMVVYFPKDRTAHFFDATDKGHDISGLPPIALGGARALVLDPLAPRFVTIADYPPHGSPIVSERSIRIVEDRDAAVEETLRLHGYFGGFVRRQLADADEVARLRWVQERVEGQQPVPEIEDLRVVGLQDPLQPLVLEMRYTIRDAFRRAADRITGALPAIWEGVYVVPPVVAKRSTPFWSAYPMDFRSRATLVLPEGFTLDAKGAPGDRQGESPWAKWSLREAAGPGELSLEYEHFRPAARGSAEEYGRFREAQQEGLAAVGGRIVLIGP